MKPGDRMTWLHLTRGGYGYIVPVDAEIVRVGKSRVTIRVAKVGGELVLRHVKPEALKPRASSPHPNNP